MNSTGTEMYYQQHMSAGQAPPPQTVTSGGMQHYAHPAQPPLLQPGPAQYPTQGAYPQYSYTNGLTSPPTGPPAVSNSMGAQNVLPLPGVAPPPSNMQNQYQGFDTTGQIAPPGMKPRVTATLWEDEGSLCFQVEARGICVARREDNHMINGTKLLNVAGMTRGRRDGILKSEKVRHVVKIGPMHLKGVWIPFERALDFANKEKITELLYPLFVHNIGALLYHPANSTRTTQVMAAAERRKQEQSQMRNGQSAAGLPSLPQHHSQPSMGASLPSSQAPVQSHGNMGRPSLDRAHTFPTPPTSASSLIGPMGASDSYQWSQQGAQAHMPVDAGLNNARSMPTTPTTSPPGSGMQSMQQYPPSTQQYDSSRQMYAAPPAQQSPYPPNGQDRHLYGQPNYGKSEMGPPSSRPSGPGSASDQVDSKATNGILHQGQPGDGVGHHEDEAEHDHENEYTHDNGAYDANRAPYNYNAPPVASMPTEHQHMSPEMAGSPHQAGSGRATPRTAAAPQPYYPQQGYGTPPRGQQAPGSLYNVMSNDRGSANGAPPNDVYAPQADMGASMTNGYSAQQPLMNGTSGAIKRGRDDEDERPGSGGPGSIDLKRRKTMLEGSYSSPQYETLNRPTSAVSSRGARR